MSFYTFPITGSKPILDWTEGLVHSNETVDPIIIQDAEHLTIQCYHHHNITIGNMTEACREKPYQLPPSATFRLDGFLFRCFDHEIVHFALSGLKWNQTLYRPAHTNLMKAGGHCSQTARSDSS